LPVEGGPRSRLRSSLSLCGWRSFMWGTVILLLIAAGSTEQIVVQVGDNPNYMGWAGLSGRSMRFRVHSLANDGAHARERHPEEPRRDASVWGAPLRSSAPRSPISPPIGPSGRAPLATFEPALDALVTVTAEFGLVKFADSASSFSSCRRLGPRDGTAASNDRSLCWCTVTLLSLCEIVRRRRPNRFASG